MIDKQIEKLLGIPYKYGGSDYKGMDCINLCVEVGKLRGFYIPNVNHDHVNYDEYAGLFILELSSKRWNKVLRQPDSLVVFRIGGIARHVGYMLDEFEFIHILEDQNVSVESLKDPKWSTRVQGFYKPSD